MVTALEVETGQVVTAGQPVVKLARLDEKEIHIDIPEQRVAGIELRRESQRDPVGGRRPCGYGAYPRNRGGGRPDQPHLSRQGDAP